MHRQLTPITAVKINRPSARRPPPARIPSIPTFAVHPPPTTPGLPVWRHDMSGSLSPSVGFYRQKKCADNPTPEYEQPPTMIGPRTATTPVPPNPSASQQKTTGKDRMIPQPRPAEPVCQLMPSNSCPADFRVLAFQRFSVWNPSPSPTRPPGRLFQSVCAFVASCLLAVVCFPAPGAVSCKKQSPQNPESPQCVAPSSPATGK